MTEQADSDDPAPKAGAGRPIAARTRSLVPVPGARARKQAARRKAPAALAPRESARRQQLEEPPAPPLPIKSLTDSPILE